MTALAARVDSQVQCSHPPRAPGGRLPMARSTLHIHHSENLTIGGRDRRARSRRNGRRWRRAWRSSWPSPTRRCAPCAGQPIACPAGQLRLSLRTRHRAAHCPACFTSNWVSYRAFRVCGVVTADNVYCIMVHRTLSSDHAYCNRDDHLSQYHWLLLTIFTTMFARRYGRQISVSAIGYC
jgi:hypothetical protein